MKTTEDKQVSILKYTKNKSHTPSDIRHFNIPNIILDSMEEQRLESYLMMFELVLTLYEDEGAINYLSFPIHQVHIVDPMLYWVDIGCNSIPASKKRYLKGFPLNLDVALFQ